MRRGSNGNAPIPANAAPVDIGEQINANTVAIVSGNINAAWLTIAYDLSAVLDDGNNFRVLPVIGKGGAQNIRDVRYLKGIDLGITVTSVLGKFRRTGEIGNIDNTICYITKLFDDEMHVIVRANSGITSLQQLDGKKVNFSDLGSATEVSAGDVFDRLGIRPIEVNMGQSDAYEKIKSGEITATIQFGGKPAPAIAKLRASDGWRLLPVPYDKRLQQDYLPSSLSSEDYPGLITKGQSIETIAYGAVMIAYNWPKDSDRYRRVAEFVDRFFSHFADFQKPPRHPTWREVNLAADLPGWKRFPEAQAWLDSHRGSAVKQADFNSFLAQRGEASSADLTVDQREELFREFLNWKNEERQRQ
ncbi:MAG TPA: TAXI family TRAP transporter solute-binding subunit [Xanthobacteraceae bacterium]|jgi:TRAP transporter TAXI family solute receptor